MPENAVAVIDQPAEAGMIEWNLDAFPVAAYNRLVPVATLQLPTDLLRPVVQIVKLNPDPKAGDVYASRDMPEGHGAPTRVGLRKFATAAGISFIDERRVDDGRDPDVIEVTCLAEMLLPTGQRIRATGMKRIDLNAQVWKSPEHRGKYKSFFQEHVASRAQNRAIRALLSLRGSYPLDVYQRPFAVVSFAPNMAHPEVRARILDGMTGTVAQLYGPANQKALAPGNPIDVTTALEDDPAPATPTILPGEKLAAASTDEPAWMQPVAPAAAAERTFIERLQDNAAAAAIKGPMTEAQIKTLGDVLGPVRAIIGSVVRAAWGDEATSNLTAAQAAAIIAISNAYENDEEFHAAWTAASESTKAAAA